MKKLIEFFKRRIIWLCLLIVVCMIGIAGYKWLPWASLTERQFPAWLAAIGSIGAFAGTIFIASSQERFRRHEKMLAAKIGATGMVLRAARMHSQTLHAAEWFGTFSREDGDLDRFVSFKNFLSDIPVWKQEELVLLAPLPKACALKLAAAQDRVAAAIHLIGVFASAPDFFSNKADRMQNAAVISGTLEQAQRYAKTAFKEMENQTFNETDS